MKDYISREDAVMVAGDMLSDLTGMTCKAGEDKAREYFKSIPSTDIRENVHGKWVEYTDHEIPILCKCTNCGWVTAFYESFDFCPNCGAEMKNTLAMNKTIKAEWICLGHRMGFCKHPDSVDYKCSNCGHEEYTLYFPPPDKCPNCGAQMEK